MSSGGGRLLWGQCPAEDACTAPARPPATCLNTTGVHARVRVCIFRVSIAAVPAQLDAGVRAPCAEAVLERTMGLFVRLFHLEQRRRIRSSEAASVRDWAA